MPLTSAFDIPWLQPFPDARFGMGLRADMRLALVAAIPGVFEAFELPLRIFSGESAGDKFRLGSALDDGVLLLGRRTWQLFSRLWPGRGDPFAARMNAVPKLVASRTLTGTSVWANSPSRRPARRRRDPC